MTTKIETLNVSDTEFGIVLSGFNLKSELSAQDVAVIRDALLRYHVICLRGASLSAYEFDRLGRYLGEPQEQLLREHRHPECVTVSVFDSTYPTLRDKPKDLNLDRRSGWHTDDSYFEIPAKITLLQGLAIPSVGGETRFCNARQAYEDLTAPDKNRIASYLTVHSYDTIRAPARAVTRSDTEAAETRDVQHPLVRTHDETGQEALYFNSNRTDHIVGLEREESDRELDWIHLHMTQEKYQYHHRWQIGDVLIWDNRSVTHSVNMDFPVGEPRIHQRLLLAGLRPR